MGGARYVQSGTGTSSTPVPQSVIHFSASAEHEFTVPQSAALHAVGLLSSVVPPEGCCLQTWLNIPDDRVFS